MKANLVILATTLLAGVVFADTHLPEVQAEVRRVDHTAGKLTLRHGNIPNLDMPPMTMVFQVSEGVVMDDIEPGDKVVVTIEEVDGAYTLKSIREETIR